MIPNRATRLRDMIRAATAGLAVIPALTLLHGGAPLPQSLLGAALALLACLLVIRLLPRPLLWLRLLGVLQVALMLWLLGQTSFPLTTWLVAAFLGFGLGLMLPRGRRRAVLITGTAAALALAAIAWQSARLALGVGWLIALSAYLADPGWDSEQPLVRAARPRASAAIGIALLLGSSLTTAWVGASTAKAAWFGDVVSHGPRTGNEVAITFDDGPNATYTLQVRDILDRYGVKATFFTVGKALDARPDVSRALLDDGMLLGDHSYHHDSTSWLKPNYPEIPETQTSFERRFGLCPAFFRPPHGTHTPFMGHVAAQRGMTMVTWDVSAGDWATTDGNLVARRVLEQVQPGSIILLHDSIDGNLDADRAVLLTALPQILDGLEARGLRPVRLDQLLNLPATVPCRPGG